LQPPQPSFTRPVQASAFTQLFSRNIGNLEKLMRNFSTIGPSLVVLGAAAAALVVAPLAVRSWRDAQASSDIVRAASILEEVPQFGASRTTLGTDEATVGQSAGVLASDVPSDIPSAQRAERDALAALPLLEQINRAHRAIARLVEPSVVHVSTMMTMQRRNFSAPYASSGSGWIWNEDGYIVTNAHVVEGSDRLQVQFYDGELREAELVGLDLRSDIAVIKVAAGGLHASQKGDSSTVEQGDMVFAFGSPFDFRFSMSSGIVSGLGRTAGLADIDYENFIQTDAAINPGNSGGPLTDIRGRVIGMNTAIATGRGNGVGQGQFAGIGLAIPMSMIESTVTQIIETGEVRKGYLGIRMIPMEELRLAAGVGRAEAELAEIAEAFKGDGILISEVTTDSPAQRAGLLAGDVIMSANGQRVASNESVSSIIASRGPGAEVRFEVWRLKDDGTSDKFEISATLAELDASVNLAPYLPSALARAGIRAITTANAERAGEKGVPFRRGILIEDVEESSEIAEIVPEGSTITAVFDQQVGSLDEFYTRVNRAVQTLAGQRRGMVRRIEIPLTIVVPDGRIVQIAVQAP
jgi:serine protease Do